MTAAIAATTLAATAAGSCLLAHAPAMGGALSTQISGTACTHVARDELGRERLALTALVLGV